MFNYYLDAFRVNYTNFEGRARRSEYWYFQLFNIVAIVFLAMIGGVFGISSGEEGAMFAMIPYFLYILAVILPSIAIVVRRLHDVGKSGWFVFIGLIPLIGSIWLLVLYCTEGDKGPNEYGPDPKDPNAGFGNYDNDVDSIGENISRF